jgi:hypothetical protein
MNNDSHLNKVVPIEIVMDAFPDMTYIFTRNCFTNAEIGFSYIVKEATISYIDGKAIRTITKAELLECYIMDTEGNRLPPTPPTTPTTPTK